MSFPDMPPTKKSHNTFWAITAGCLLLVMCGILFAGAGLTGAILLYRYDQAIQPTVTPATNLADKTMPLPTPTSLPETAVSPPQTPPVQPSPPATEPPILPTPSDEPPPVSLPIFPPEAIDQRPIPRRAYADLETLLTLQIPVNDYFETAETLSSHKYGERTVTTPPFQLGDRQTFITDDGRIQATLLGVTPHAYFWVEDGLNYNQAQVQAIAERLETEYYPQLVSLFGQEWQPGVDNDPHFSILHLVGAGNNSELGYFSSVDEYPRALYSDSNQQELVYIIMNEMELGEDLYYGTLVHEIQHLIQWYMDPNEATWLNEGLSQLAEIYLGFDTATAVDYIHNPDTQLNSWDYETEDVDAHYSAAYLYSVYVWEQLGETAVQELSRHPANGLASINAILQGYAPERTLADFTADWVAANYLDDAGAGPRYEYKNLDLGRPTYEWRVKQLPQENLFELNQFATHDINLDLRGPLTVTFAGSTLAPLMNTHPRSGEQVWFAPAQDESNARLTAVFDLTDLTSATLNFAAWYDLEEDYDYAYVSISTDSGATWELLLPDHASAGEFGPGYNGRSEYENDHKDGWVKESISLNNYVGQPVIIRFHVLTDSAVSRRGFAIDNITIPELGYRSDAETPAPEWDAQGFVQIGQQLPQQWAVQLIQPEGDTPTVTRLPLNALNQGQWRLNINKTGGILAITPLTPFVNQPAQYWLKLEE
jgi:hypothetical protein